MNGFVIACVLIVVMILVALFTGILGWVLTCEDSPGTYSWAVVGWLISSVGLGLCIVIFMCQTGFIS